MKVTVSEPCEVIRVCYSFTSKSQPSENHKLNYVALMRGKRRRRWANIKTILGRRPPRTQSYLNH